MSNMVTLIEAKFIIVFGVENDDVEFNFWQFSISEIRKTTIFILKRLFDPHEITIIFTGF